MFFLFFSSRRRHTRLQGDWSSDVCSSDLRTPLGVAVAAILGLAFSFSGLALAIARYPHFEMLIAGSAMLLFVALWQGRIAAVAVFFAICLATREDAGFH